MRVHTKKHHTTKKETHIKGAVNSDDYFKEYFGDRPEGSISLAGLRYREDYTQKELGDLIGVKQSNISQMERGLRPIGKTIAKRLARVFKVDYRDFL